MPEPPPSPAPPRAILLIADAGDGPELQALAATLPATLHAPLLVHAPAPLAAALAPTATADAPLHPGARWQVPDGLVLDPAGTRLVRDAADGPPLERLAGSVARAYGRGAVVVVLSAGTDALRAADAVRAAGGTTVAACAPAEGDRLPASLWAFDFGLPAAEIGDFLARLAAGGIPGKLRQPAPHPIVLLGASAGGVEAFKQVAAALPADFQAPVFMLLHRRRDSQLDYTMLERILAAEAALPVRVAEDGEEIQDGHIYLPRAGQHLLVGNHRIEYADAPEDSEWRPAIDPLFESAATSYGPRVIGVLLTGMLDDGVRGLNRITAYGGITIAQSPEDAYAPNMPLNAILRDHPNYVVPLHDLVPLLVELTCSRFPGRPVAESVAFRAAVAAAREKAELGVG